MRWHISVVMCIALIALAMSGCGDGHGGLRHGLLETASGSVFWVALEGEVRFMVVIDPPVSQTGHENWEGTEFNVYYDIEQHHGRTPIMVYGDIDEGVITAAYDDAPLDLDQGKFFTARGGQVTALSPSEKSAYLAQIDP